MISQVLAIYSSCPEARKTGRLTHDGTVFIIREIAFVVKKMFLLVGFWRVLLGRSQYTIKYVCLERQGRSPGLGSAEKVGDEQQTGNATMAPRV